MKILKYLVISLAVISYGCADDFVDTVPTLELPGETAITDVASAESALIGMYSAMQLIGTFGGDDTFISGLYADELTHTGSFPSFAEMGANDPALNNVEVTGYWDDHYAAIYRANFILNAIGNPEYEISQDSQNRIGGQARAARAILYYKLVKVFGGVPIILDAFTSSTDIDTNPTPRSSVDAVYDLIYSDISTAVDILPEGLGRYFFNKDAARVLKAKIEMELGDYASAEATLAPVLGAYSLESNYASLFPSGGLVASPAETIFSIDFNETDGSNHAFFFLDAGRGEVGPSAELSGAFENGDLRANLIDGNNDIAKYSDAGAGNDDVYVFRYADVLLMQAELLARRNDPAASDYINMVRTRAGLGNVVLNSTNVVDLIAQERFVEFFGEGQDRLFTITRLGIADDVISNKANNVFIAERNNLWPIPQQEIERNSEIGTEDQNPGY